MDKNTYWQNFELGTELDIAGGFIYDGLRQLHNMSSLYYESDIFSVLYNLSVGLERFLKVVVILLEYDEAKDQEEFEKSLITHNHLKLLDRIELIQTINLGKVHKEFLALLGKFYKSFRYDRYSLQTVESLSKEKRALLAYLSKHLNIDVEEKPPLKVVDNTPQIKRFLGRVVGKIVSNLYDLVQDGARKKGIYTYETRYYSKTYKLVLGKEFDFVSEDVLWKEILIYLLNTAEKSEWLNFLKGIEPLEFDAALINDYLQCLGNDIKKIEVSDELEALYEEIENKSARLEMLDIIANPHVSFD